MSLAVKLEEKYNYKDYLSWDDNKQWELIYGRAYCMSPAPSTEHQKITRDLLTAINIFLKNKPCQVFAAPFDVRFSDKNQNDGEIETVVQPDIVVICDESKIDERGAKGVPDLVIEVTSPSTIDRDIKDKFELYEKYGVKEYWIVYPAEKCVIVYKLSPDGKYQQPKMFSKSDKIDVEVILKGLKIDLREIFGETKVQKGVKKAPKVQ